MNFHVEFSYVPNDYAEFNAAYIRHARSLTPASQRGLRSPWLPMWASMAVIVAIFYALPTVPEPPTTAPAPRVPLGQALLAFCPYAAILLLIFFWYIWIRRSGVVYRRLAPQVLRMDESRTVDITDAGITIRELGAVTQTEWSYYIRFIESRTLFLFFITPRTAHILPKRAFASEADLHEFRAFAQAHIGNQPVGFPVQQVAPPPVQPATRAAREA